MSIGFPTKISLHVAQVIAGIESAPGATRSVRQKLIEWILANHIEQRLPAFFFDGFERALQGVGNFRWLFNPRGIGATRLRRQLELRRGR